MISSGKPRTVRRANSLILRVSGRRRAVLATAVVATASGVGSALAQIHAAQARPIVTIQARIRPYVPVGEDYVPFGVDQVNVNQATRFTPREVTFSPNLVNVGTVEIIVHNGDDEPHQMEIDGVKTRTMGPGGTALIRVTFKRPGWYSVAVSSDNPIPVSGRLRVIA